MWIIGELMDRLNINKKDYPAVFFHKPEEPDGYLSNWYPSSFLLDGIRFSSVEQYIMFEKCRLFGGPMIARFVLETDDPKEQQKIGQSCPGYVGKIWSGKRQLVVERALMAKFTQDKKLKKMLLDTGDAYLV